MENATYIARTSGIGTRDKIGYMMGDLGSLLVFGLVQSVLRKYYTDVLGITPWAIMIMFVVATRSTTPSGAASSTACPPEPTGATATG